MKRYFHATDEFGEKGKYRFLTERPYEPIAWAYVRRGENPELLVAKKSSGKLVIPGGHIKRNEASLEAARRECKEETGVETDYKSDGRTFLVDEENILIKPRDGVVVVTSRQGSNYGFWAAYPDKDGTPGKRYFCYIEELDHLTEPYPDTKSDVTEPRFINLGEAFSSRDLFTPAVAVLLEIAEAHTKGTDILLSGDFVVLPDYRLGGYLRVSEPTDS